MRLLVHVYERISPLWEQYRSIRTKHDKMILHFSIAFRTLLTQKNSNNWPSSWVKKFILNRRFYIPNYYLKLVIHIWLYLSFCCRCTCQIRQWLLAEEDDSLIDSFWSCEQLIFKTFSWQIWIHPVPPILDAATNMLNAKNLRLALMLPVSVRPIIRLLEEFAKQVRHVGNMCFSLNNKSKMRPTFKFLYSSKHWNNASPTGQPTYTHESKTKFDLIFKLQSNMHCSSLVFALDEHGKIW